MKIAGYSERAAKARSVQPALAFAALTLVGGATVGAVKVFALRDFDPKFEHVPQIAFQIHLQLSFVAAAVGAVLVAALHRVPQGASARWRVLLPAVFGGLFMPFLEGLEVLWLGLSNGTGNVQVPFLLGLVAYPLGAGLGIRACAASS